MIIGIPVWICVGSLAIKSTRVSRFITSISDSRPFSLGLASSAGPKLVHEATGGLRLDVERHRHDLALGTQLRALSVDDTGTF